MQTVEPLEIEIVDDCNRQLHFLPAGKTIRGHFDLNKIHEPQKAKLYQEWSQPIPGQIIRFDFVEGRGYIVEPLHRDENEPLRNLIKQRGNFIHEKETAINADAATMLYWMKRAVDGGNARVVKGKLPDTIEGEPRKRFSGPPEPEKGTSLNEVLKDLAAAIKIQARTSQAILEKLSK